MSDGTSYNPTSAVDVLRRIACAGGAIVSTSGSTQDEINEARKSGNLYVDQNGYGFIIRPREWRQLAEASIKQVIAEHTLPQAPDGYRWDENHSLTLIALDDHVSVGAVLEGSSGWTFTGGRDNVPNLDTRDAASFALLKALDLIPQDAERHKWPDVQPA